MRRIAYWSVTVGAALLASGAQNVAAQEDADDALRARIAQLERTVSQLQAASPYRLAADEHVATDQAADGGGCGDCWGPKNVGPDFFTDRVRCTTLYTGMEFVWMRPYFSEDFGTVNNADPGFLPSWRMWLGRQWDDGLGARVRYWEIDQLTTDPAAVTTRVGTEFRTFDLELTQAVDFRRWGFLVSGGLRHVDANVTQGTVDRGFDGAGLTLGLEASRDLDACGTWQWVTKGRWSALYGDSSSFNYANSTFSRDHDDLIHMLEISMGPTWTREVGNNVLTLGATAEAQHYSNIPGAFDTQDFGFFGFGLNFQIAR